jgi:DNA-binding response OmpR family regulator
VATTALSQYQKPIRRKVLLIEPSPESNTSLAKIFEEPVWAVSYAEDNEKAVEMAKKETFDLMLTNAATTCAEDIVPLQKLRMVRPHTRVIILTNERQPGDILRAIRNHAFSYFTMPIATDDLRDLIEQVLRQPAWDDGIEVIQASMEHVELAVQCNLETLDRLMHFMREGATLPEAESEEVAFAFREIMLNAMEHGGKYDPSKYVEVSYLRAKRMVMCRVKDPGEGFSLNEIWDAEMVTPIAEQVAGGEAIEFPPRGLGILMAKRFVDELIFSEKGNEAFLIKYLPKHDEMSDRSSGED